MTLLLDFPLRTDSEGSVLQGEAGTSQLVLAEGLFVDSNRELHDGGFGLADRESGGPAPVHATRLQKDTSVSRDLVATYFRQMGDGAVGLAVFHHGPIGPCRHVHDEGIAAITCREPFIAPG